MSAESARPRWAGPAAITLGLAAVAVYGTNITLALTMPASVPSLDFTLASALAPIVPFTALAVVALVLVYQRPRNTVAWLLVTLMLAFPVSGLGSLYVFHYLYSPDLPRWLVVPVGLGAAAISSAVALPLALLMVVFPDGKPLSRRWAWMVWLCLAIGAANLLVVFDPAALGDGHRRVVNPLAFPALQGAIGFMNSGGSVSWFAVFIVGLAGLVVRFRRADADQRQQIKWFGAGLTVLILCLFGGILTATTSAWTTPAPIAFEVIGFSALPVCVGVAVLKYRLYDIDLVINRALVYGLLAVLITAVYVGIVVGVGAILGGGGKPNLGLSIIATAVVAVGFQPVRERVQRLGNRLVYGRRATPYEVLAEFSGRVAEAYAADAVLPRMAAALAAGTAAVNASVWLRAGDELRVVATYPAGANGHAPVAVAGQILPALPDAGRTVAVRHQGELLGALGVVKRPGETLSPIEEQLLADLARQAGLVLKNVRLAADLEARRDDLQASRRRMLKAQDDERRRLERTLRDGPEQQLAGMRMKLGMARAQAVQSPSTAKEMLQQLKAETDETLESLRDLARGIYPPLLADNGLRAALEAQARKASVRVSVDADGVGRYPQQLEAAVYFCCLEALENVRQHAAAQAATIRVAESGETLEFSVEDDGAGFDPGAVERGVGLTNMGDRLDALGGSLEVTSRPAGGTRVSGRLPLAATVSSA